MPRRRSRAPDLNPRSAVAWELLRYDGRFAVRVIRSRRTGQVLYLEAGKDFIDTLLSFLLLPMGTIIHILPAEAKHYGSLSSMYKSVDKLDSSLLLVDKDYILVQPRPTAINPAGLCKATTSTGLLQLCLDADATKQTTPKKKLILPERFFKCDNCDGLSSKQRERRYNCWPENRGYHVHGGAACRFREGPYYLSSEDVERQDAHVTEQEPVEEYNRSTGPGFVMEPVTFMVTDNLEIMPASTTESMRVLNALKVSSLADVEGERITVTITQVLQLFQSALSSTTCLNDVFRIGGSSESPGQTSSVPTDEATVQFLKLRTDSP